MGFKITKTVILNQGSSETKKKEIKQYFLDTIELENSLFSLLKNDESFYQRPEILRHPLVFYFGHTFTFYINKLWNGKFIKDRVHPQMEALFAIGVDEMSWDDLNEKNYDWPPISAVREYRDHVRDLVLDFIDNTELYMPIDWESPFWAIMMGIEHHRIHIETSSVLIRQLDLKYLQESQQWQPNHSTSEAPQNQLIPVDAGSVFLGRDKNNFTYGWDNEYGRHHSELQSFKASRYLVTNKEFKEFIDHQGYNTQKWWTNEGWKWRNFTQAEKPVFWVTENKQFLLRTLEREIPMPWDWPAEVNYFEAKAFCLWKSEVSKSNIRLPSEDEWHLLYQSERVTSPHDWTTAPGNINLEHGPSSCSVTKFKFDKFYDVIGNVWQWTETPIYPYDGFKVHSLYDDFSVPTFDQQHNLIKGGSWISTGNELLTESRYAFRKHFFQHAGFRYVESTNPVKIDTNPYETDSLLSQYCEFHFGDSYFSVPNFPKNCIDQCEKYFHHLPGKNRALDLGCALGRSTFELGKYFSQVTGLDFSARFIDKAQAFLNEGIIRYSLTTEGELVQLYERYLADLNLNQLNGTIEFYQADACNLPSKYSNYDFIFAGNLIDRLHSPRAFLHRIHQHMNPGGILAICSPYTWLEDYTPKEEWIGGYIKNGIEISTLEGLQTELHANFQQIADPIEVPFVIRETKRKFQHTISELTLWKKL